MSLKRARETEEADSTAQKNKHRFRHSSLLLLERRQVALFGDKATFIVFLMCINRTGYFFFSDITRDFIFAFHQFVWRPIRNILPSAQHLLRRSAITSSKDNFEISMHAFLHWRTRTNEEDWSSSIDDFSGPIVQLENGVLVHDSWVSGWTYFATTSDDFRRIPYLDNIFCGGRCQGAAVGEHIFTNGTSDGGGAMFFVKETGSYERPVEITRTVTGLNGPSYDGFKCLKDGSVVWLEGCKVYRIGSSATKCDVVYELPKTSTIWYTDWSPQVECIIPGVYFFLVGDQRIMGIVVDTKNAVHYKLFETPSGKRPFDVTIVDGSVFVKHEKEGNYYIY